MSQITSSIARSNDSVAHSASLHVDMIADFVCPFCFVGKRRLDEALKAVRGPNDVRWYPYQLNPAMPADGQPFDAYLAQRFGSRVNVEPVLKHLAAEGKPAGIQFRFDKIRQVPNTLAAHQVMYQAETAGRDQAALADSLMTAFFEQGRDIGERQELVDIGGEHDIAAADVEAAIDSDEIRQIVQTREDQFRSTGISGVPGFLLNRRMLIVGAQSADTIVAAFDRAMFGEGTDALESAAPH